MDDYKEFPTKESALDWLDNYLSLDERNNLIRVLEQEPSEDMVSRGVFEQVIWERDVAIEQLKELGYGLGEKIKTDKDAISRQAVFDAMYELCNTGETLEGNPWRDNPHIDAITDAIENLPSVTPQPFINKPCVSEGVCREDKIQVLDKIRAEIAKRDRNVKAIRNDGCCFFTKDEILNILDKYKAESEE